MHPNFYGGGILINPLSEKETAVTFKAREAYKAYIDF